jgi:hypothetical protein
MSEPSTFSMLQSRFGADVAADVVAELRMGWELDKTLAKIEQERIARATDRIESAHVDGLGQHIAQIDLTAYLYWHQRTNGECWKDDGFFREFLRDNPAARPTATSRRTTVAISTPTPAAAKRGIILTND